MKRRIEGRGLEETTARTGLRTSSPQVCTGSCKYLPSLPRTIYLSDLCGGIARDGGGARTRVCDSGVCGREEKRQRSDSNLTVGRKSAFEGILES